MDSRVCEGPSASSRYPTQMTQAAQPVPATRRGLRKFQGASKHEDLLRTGVEQGLKIVLGTVTLGMSRVPWKAFADQTFTAQFPSSALFPPDSVLPESPIVWLNY